MKGKKKNAPRQKKISKPPEAPPAPPVAPDDVELDKKAELEKKAQKIRVRIPKIERQLTEKTDLLNAQLKAALASHEAKILPKFQARHSRVTEKLRQAHDRLNSELKGIEIELQALHVADNLAISLEEIGMLPGTDLDDGFEDFKDFEGLDPDDGGDGEDLFDEGIDPEDPEADESELET